MKLALLFPGQGSQQPGMGKFLVDHFPVAQQVFEEASDAIGLDLEKLCFTGSVEDLALTANTQPCLLTVSIATWKVLQHEFGLKIEVAAGHSIGEYGALVAARVMEFAFAVQAVRLRGEAMQAAVPVGQGGMTAVMGLEASQVEYFCQEVVKRSGFGPLSVANYNSPGQIVISGATQALEFAKTLKAEDLWPEKTPRLKLIPLSVSAPFHCAMMKPAEEKMRARLSEIPFSAPDFPVIQNLVAEPVRAPDLLLENLIRQVSAPVKWMQSMETLKKMGVSTALECGTGKVLQGLLKKIDSEFFKVFNTNSLEDLKSIEALVESLNK